MGNYKFDDATASIILVPKFSQLLQKIQCPVLAIFGEKDSQVDWQRTLALYKKTIDANHESELTIKTFPECGHPILKCKTCGVDYDDLKIFGYQPCDGYYDTMALWLKDHAFVE